MHVSRNCKKCQNSQIQNYMLEVLHFGFEKLKNQQRFLQNVF